MLQKASSSKLDKAMDPEQFDQIVDAILAGKYSWACILILRFAGYNPLHYVPYRTYVRVVKENCQSGELKEENTRPQDPSTVKAISAHSSKLSYIKDLSHLKEVNQKQTKVRGGSRILWFLN